MTKDDLCKMLDGREYIDEISTEIKEKMKGTGLVVVFGGSDDEMEFRGAINDEVGCYSGGMAYLDEPGLLKNECWEEDCPYFERIKKQALTIKALWCVEPDICWTYETKIPHSTFIIMEDGKRYCRGIVFDLAEVQKTIKTTK